MKKVFFIATFVLVVVIGIAGAFIFLDNKDTISSAASAVLVIGNKELVDKMEWLYNINLQRDLTLDDLKGIDGLVEGDHFAEDEYKELYWFVEKNELNHISHSITALEVYASTGQKSFCIKDEMSHIRTYIKHNEEELIAHGLDEVTDNLKSWQENVKKIQKDDPSYFTNFEDIKRRVNDVISKIKKGDRSKEVSSLLYYIETYGVC